MHPSTSILPLSTNDLRTSPDTISTSTHNTYASDPPPSYFEHDRFSIDKKMGATLSKLWTPSAPTESPVMTNVSDFQAELRFRRWFWTVAFAFIFLGGIVMTIVIMVITFKYGSVDQTIPAIVDATKKILRRVEDGNL